MWLMLLFGCVPIAGEWAGEADCDGAHLEITVSLEPEEGGYVGWGSLDCTALYGDDCIQSFEIEAELDERDVEVDLDDCVIHTFDGEQSIGCDDPDDLEWDGADHIEGDWSGCEVELDRE